MTARPFTPDQRLFLPRVFSARAQIIRARRMHKMAFASRGPLSGACPCQRLSPLEIRELNDAIGCGLRNLWSLGVGSPGGGCAMREAKDAILAHKKMTIRRNKGKRHA